LGKATNKKIRTFYKNYFGFGTNSSATVLPVPSHYAGAGAKALRPRQGQSSRATMQFVQRFLSMRKIMHMDCLPCVVSSLLDC
jgi:hypothetical protein